LKPSSFSHEIAELRVVRDRRSGLQDGPQERIR
jgi:hypothetical protein